MRGEVFEGGDDIPPERLSCGLSNTSASCQEDADSKHMQACGQCRQRTRLDSMAYRDLMRDDTAEKDLKHHGLCKDGHASSNAMRAGCLDA